MQNERVAPMIPVPSSEFRVHLYPTVWIGLLQENYIGFLYRSLITSI